MEIHENFISPEAAELDRIQSEYDVIFIVAGTNKPISERKRTMRIGAPADSLNSIVVNAVDSQKMKHLTQEQDQYYLFFINRM